MPESSVQGWQTTGYGKPIISLRLNVPVTGFLHPCWNVGFADTARLVYNDVGPDLGMRYWKLKLSVLQRFNV